jgi:hypothetical protein
MSLPESSRLETLDCSDGSRAGLVSDDSTSRPAIRSAGPSFRVPVCVEGGGVMCRDADAVRGVE